MQETVFVNNQLSISNFNHGFYILNPFSVIKNGSTAGGLILGEDKYSKKVFSAAKTQSAGIYD